MRKVFLAGIALLAILPVMAQKQPNIIFILADDLGYGDVGFNGGNKILTPTLDQMAKEGVVFNRHYSGSTVCGPSRACLMSGFHTGHSAVRENPAWTKSGKPVDFKKEDVTVAEELKKAGYVTGIVGKWGLAENLDAGQPNRQGFDYFYGFNRHGKAHHYYPEELFENETLFKLEGNVMMDKIGKYTQDLFIEKALGFIEEHHNKPFFLYFAPTIPHYELTISEDQKDYYYKQNWPLREMKMGHYRNDKNGHVTYASMVTRLDKDVNRILESLKKYGIDDNTLVIFTSDNGHEYDNVNDEFLNSNGIFRGKKRDLYEGGIRVPFVARWPSQISGGTKSNHISAFWDFLPTACEIARVKPSEKVDGISFLPALKGNLDNQEKHDYMYWEFNEGRGPLQALLKDDWKLVKLHSANKTELYNIKDDPSEITDVYEKYSDIALELEEILKTARTEHPEFPLVKKVRKRK